MLFTQTAAQRILTNVKKVIEVRVLKNVVLVRFVSLDGQKCATFVSKKAFGAEFVNYRAQRGAALVAEGKVTEADGGFWVEGSKDVYLVTPTATSVECACEDLHFQRQAFGKGVCYHGYAALNMMGYSRLSDYVAAQQKLDQLVA